MQKRMFVMLMLIRSHRPPKSVKLLKNHSQQLRTITKSGKSKTYSYSKVTSITNLTEIYLSIEIRSHKINEGNIIKIWCTYKQRVSAL